MKYKTIDLKLVHWFVSGVIGGHVTLTGARLVHWFVCVWCDRGSCDSPVRGSFIGWFVSGVIGGHVTLTGARLVHWFVRVWCDRGSCDSHRCPARSLVCSCLV